MDLAPIVRLETPLLEIFVRGTLTYLALFVLLRVTLKRESAGVGMTNLLVLVLIADAAQNAMADDYRSVTDGILLVGVIMSWSVALQWLSYRFPKLERLVHPPSLLLVRNGRMLRHNMRKELVTEEELRSQMREQGIASLDDVREAYIEGDGMFSFVTRERGGNPGRSLKQEQVVP